MENHRRNTRSYQVLHLNSTENLKMPTLSQSPALLDQHQRSKNLSVINLRDQKPQLNSKLNLPTY